FAINQGRGNLSLDLLALLLCLVDPGTQGSEECRRLRVGIADEIRAQLLDLVFTAPRTIELDDCFEVFWQACAGTGTLGTDPSIDRVINLALLGSPGLDPGFVPVNCAVILRECPAVDHRSGLQLEARRRYLEPDPFARRGQIADPQPLGSA